MKEKENLSHTKYAPKVVTEWTVLRRQADACMATTFQKILSGQLREAGKQDLTETYLLQGMKNFPEKTILRK